ncbi:MAG: hypothetical protein D6808_01375 [Candidatus Dadabacteria bacterium]|nr:MAG: hypothetical protein D6808_01375 [Candidatus Dadabacteria bacterium]
MKLTQTALPFKSKKRLRPGKSAGRSDTALRLIWENLVERFFPTHQELYSYTIIWSNRNQKRTLASCSIERKIVRVAKELNHPKFFGWVEPLLYHEMCHAVLKDNVYSINSRKQWHGPQFKALEKRHPLCAKLDEWIRSGGWLSAIRSHRSREYHKRLKKSLRVSQG